MTKREQYRALISYLKGAPVDISAFDFGVGKMKEMLLPIDDKDSWSNTDLEYFQEASDLHDAIKLRFGDDYEDALDSLKNGTLTSYFTPTEIVSAQVRSLIGSNVATILEPSAGSGNYIGELLEIFPNAVITAIEKDQLTAAVLSDRTAPVRGRVNVHNRPLEEDRTDGYDLVISNIPFGDIQVYDSQLYREANPEKIKASTRIHNYFFVKALDKLRNGGIVSFLATSAVMDSPKNEGLRQYLVRNADLVSAWRLPDSVFRSEQTFPSTDIIVLRKNNAKKVLSEDEKKFISVTKIELPDPKGVATVVPINSFYIGSQNVIGELACDGQYGYDSAVSKWRADRAELQAELDRMSFQVGAALKNAKAVEQKDINIKSAASKAPAGFISIDPSMKLPPSWETGHLFAYRGKAGTLERRPEGDFLKPIAEIKDPARVLAISQLRNQAKNLINAERDPSQSESLQAKREELNTLYDNYVFTYGPLHKSPNLISLDKDEPLLLSLEKVVDRDGARSYEKADIFTMQVNGVVAELAAPSNLADAIIYSLNATGRLDLELMSSVMGTTPEMVAEQGIREKLIYFEVNDGGQVVPVTKDVFESGNIYQKIERMQDPALALPFGGEGYKESLLMELEAHLPVPVPFELIDLNLGERWVPDDVYSKFATHLFEVETDVVYLAGTKNFLVSTKGWSAKEYTGMAVSPKEGGTIRGSELLKYALMNTSPEITYKVLVPDPKDPTKQVEKRERDMDAIMLVRQKIEEIKEEFARFIAAKQEIKADLEDRYNKTMNNIALRRYDGSHLELAGLQFYKPFPTQKNAVWQVLQQNGGIIDGKVGSGKTLIAAMSAMEMRRLGIARKPMMICMKANAAAIAADFKRAYPEAKVLYPRPTDFEPKKRREFLMKVMTNDWDCVIMTHDQFGLIPQDQEIIDAVVQAEINAMANDAALLKGREKGYDKSMRNMMKSLEKKKASLEAKININVDGLNKDEKLPTFKELGIDHLFVDESHCFKNIPYQTHFQRVKGLGDPMGSQRALNFVLACRTIQNRLGGEKGITLLSGTIFSNSLVEMPLVMKTLLPETMAARGIDTVDSFLTTFARKSYDMEFTSTGEVRSVERFREFIKVREMLQLYRSIANVVTDENFNIDKPSIKTRLVKVNSSEEQLEFNQAIIRFVSTRDGSHIGKPGMSESEKSAYALIATNLSRRASLDMRLIDPGLPFNPDSKLAVMAENIAKIHRESEPYKGTQFVFCDVSTPNSDKFNVYDELKRILVKHHGIPADQIQFIQDHSGDKQKAKVVQAVWDGEVRVIMGSTPTLGTGVNAQKRCVAIHAADVPWKPSERDQRNGRGGRQGNWAAKEFQDNVVYEYVYATERTLDAYQFDILKNKDQFIRQTKTLNINEVDRTIRESTVGEDGALSPMELSAILSGNNDYMERAKHVKTLEALERQYQFRLSAHNDSVRKAALDIKMAEHEIDHHAKRIAGMSQDVEWLKENHKQAQEEAQAEEKAGGDKEKDPQKKGFTYPTPVDLDGSAYDNAKELGGALSQKVRNLAHIMKPGEERTIGHYGPFAIVARKQTFVETGLFSNPVLVSLDSPHSKVRYQSNNGEVHNDPVQAGLYIHRAISKSESLLKLEEEAVQKAYKEKTALSEKVKTVFHDKERPQIEELKKKIKEIDLRLATAQQQAASAQVQPGQEASVEKNVTSEYTITM